MKIMHYIFLDRKKMVAIIYTTEAFAKRKPAKKNLMFQRQFKYMFYIYLY